MKSNSQSLRELNPYLLKRFFEYAFLNEEFINKIKSNKEKTGLIPLNKSYNPQHECILMISCITSLTMKVDNEIFRNLYEIYIGYKVMSSPWRGRNEWYDFHKNIYSHFIWEDDIKNIEWIWNKIDTYMESNIKKNDQVSKWRKNWYQTYQRNLKHFVLKTCLIKENLSIIENLIKLKILNPRLVQFQKIIQEYGYSYTNNSLKLEDFTNSTEWKWLLGGSEDIKLIDFENLYKICDEIPKFKNKVIEYFSLLPGELFWNIFFKLTDSQIIKLQKKKFE